MRAIWTETLGDEHNNPTQTGGGENALSETPNITDAHKHTHTLARSGEPLHSKLRPQPCQWEPRRCFHDQPRDYATTLKHAREHASIFAQEAGRPAELMVICQSAPVSPQSRAFPSLHACCALNNAAAAQPTTAAGNKPTANNRKLLHRMTYCILCMHAD